MFSSQKVFVACSVEIAKEVVDLLTKHGAEVVSTEKEAAIVVVDHIDMKVAHSFSGVVVLGAQTVRDSVSLGKVLPKSTFPISNRVMEGIRVALHGLPEVARLVHAMNGQVTSLSDCTHVVCDNVLCDLYEEAVCRKLVVVHPSWVHACMMYVRVVDIESHILPPFSGLQICVTGLAMSTRKKLQQIVESHGGVHSPELKKSSTHLIAESPSGIKYRYALAWGIPVVTLNWIFECVNKKVCLPVQDFALSDRRDDNASSVSFKYEPSRRKRSYEESQDVPSLSFRPSPRAYDFGLFSNSAMKERKKEPEPLKTHISPRIASPHLSRDQLGGLLVKCNELLSKIFDMDVEMVLEMLENAYYRDEKLLLDACIQYVSANVEKFRHTEKFSQLDESIREMIGKASSAVIEKMSSSSGSAAIKQ